jgi:hypothetical protein
MAKAGFYEIRTFETLSRDFGTHHVQYESLYKQKESEQPTEEIPAGQGGKKI